MSDLETLRAAAESLLLTDEGPLAGDRWLWEHSLRVADYCAILINAPEVAHDLPSLDPILVAAWFYSAGWAIQAQDGQVGRWQVLGRPTNDLQRELALNAMLERAGNLASTNIVQYAAAIIRSSADRDTDIPEALVLAEAVSLDEIGLLYSLRQFRQYQAEGRPLSQFIDTWQRQQEYKYWETRIRDGLRFECSRAIARQRIAAVDEMMTGLRNAITGQDLKAMIE
ncbi:MAG: hypothetical protein KDA32_02700 [Phycisphaerales bacterium]|nr:hypothetical protein [Phycisphaerales bacterium]